MKRVNKAMSILLTLVMLVGLLLPAGGAFAATDNYVSKTKSVDDDYIGLLSTMEIIEDSDRVSDFAYGDTFVVTLPNDVDFYKDGSKITSGDAVAKGIVETYTNNGGWTKDSTAKVKATFSNERTLNITFKGENDDNAVTSKQEKVVINFWVHVDGFDGDITATVDGMDSGVTSGEYIIGRVVGGDTTNTVLSVEDIGESDGQEGGIIRIAENAAGTWSASSYITLTLNNDFYWNTATKNNISLLGGLSGYNYGTDVTASINSDEDELRIDFADGYKKTETRGIIEIKPIIDVDSDADYGDVEVDIDGEDVTAETVVIAKYADYGVTLELDGDMEEVIAGQKDQELTDMIIKETIPGSLMANRKVTIELPEGVKFMDSDSSKDGENYSGSASVTVDSGNIEIKNKSVDNDKVEFTIDKASTSASEIKVEFKNVNVAADKSGDISVKLTGSAGIDDQEFVVGKALAAVTAEAQTKEIKLGVQGQEAGDITIKESKDGAILEDKDIILELPEGVKFTVAPKVEVTEGNLDIDTDSVKRQNDDRQVVIPVDNESTRPSTIKVTGIKLTADRSVPTGDIYVKIKGEAVAETYEGYADSDVGTDDLFSASTAATVYPATLVNAAPVAGSVQFNIGSTVYSENGVAKVMDAAPYIKDGRTYVPVKYLALALGVTEDNIKYENGVVTLTKGDVTLKLTIGDKNLDNNGTVTAMDVAPEISNGRTMLPARFVAEAFGATVGYAPGTVVISY